MGQEKTNQDLLSELCSLAYRTRNDKNGRRLKITYDAFSNDIIVQKMHGCAFECYEIIYGDDDIEDGVRKMNQIRSVMESDS